MKLTPIAIALAAATTAHGLVVPRQSQSVNQQFFQGRQNLQTFSGTFGGAAPAITDSGDPDRPFSVSGTSFIFIADAFKTSCDQQLDSCVSQVNAGGAKFSLNQCQAQRAECAALLIVADINGKH